MSILNERRSNGREHRSGECLAELPVRLIVPNPDQPRRTFDEAGIAELAKSIEHVGLIQPLIVRRAGRGYELIAGERRLRAVKMLGYKTVACIVDSSSNEDDSALRAMVENLQREDLHFFEEAECFAALLNRLGATQEELGSRIGKSQSYIANKLRLLKLSQAVRSIVAEKGLTERHARALLRLRSEMERIEAAERMASEAMTIKEAERLVDSMLSDTRRASRRSPKMIRIFRDYRVFINTVASACDQLRESGLVVDFDQKDKENGVELSISITQQSSK
ncbi:MAG: ParB/RepB/Spo0J family partition protein [Clostridia bacterium]|nr:ParB/RepB/Spo0J family partition protein [Clostridia bacterium]